MKKSKGNLVRISGIVGGVIGLIINGYNQHKLIDENPNQKFDYKSLVLAGVLGSAIGMAGGKLLNFISSVFDSSKEVLNDIDEIKYLSTVIGSYSPDRIDEIIYRKGRGIKQAINDRYDNYLLGKATNQGSVDQGTALSGISDLDILIKFKKTSFSSVDRMFDSVYNFFKYNYKDTELIEVRRQTHSIGLIFDINGQNEVVDIVPVLRMDFIKGKNDYNLFKNPERTNGSMKLKMNPKKQKDFGDRENEKKEIISLIKLLKENQKLPLKSFLIKELVKKAFDEKDLPQRIDDQLLISLEFIRDNIKTIVIRSPDNQSSILSNSINDKEKDKIHDELSCVIEKVNGNKDFLQEFFPTKG